MILAHHVIITTYGFWLPNDPRGSWSDFVAAWELFAAGGPATRTTERRSVAHVEHDHSLRLRTKQALKYPPVEFHGVQAQTVARGFAEAMSTASYVMHACSILPAHVHMVIARHQRRVEQIAGHLKAMATRALDAEQLHPFSNERGADGRCQSPWAERCWKVFLDSSRDVRRAIKYVEENPLKEGKRAQRWSMVTPYRG
jgi:REP element-mobilizing transposase RayT